MSIPDFDKGGTLNVTDLTAMDENYCEDTGFQPK
jgi:hypothetical protein